MIDAAVKACACPDPSQLVFNVASVCENADKPSLKRFYNALRKCRAGASVGILKAMANVFATWTFGQCMFNLIQSRTCLDFEAPLDLFALLWQVSVQCQSTDPMAGKTLISKPGFGFSAHACKWHPFTLRNSYLTDSSNKCAMYIKDESGRGYYPRVAHGSPCM